MNRSEAILFCFCGPTASGKSTLSKRLVKELPGLALSVSTTTRQPRAGEVDERDYFFVEPEEFQRRIKEKRFIEHAEFSGHSYGTEIRNIDNARQAKNDLILDIEVQGVQQLKNLYPKQVITVFVFPPSFAELEKRLRLRRTESEEQITRRLQTARREIETLRQPSFTDYIIINDDLEQALELAKDIVSGTRAYLKWYDTQQLDKLLK